MSSIQYGIQLASVLERSIPGDKSCLVSRVHSTWGEQTWSYSTLHSVAGKVLRKKYGPEKLVGFEMFENVKKALKLTYAIEPTDRQVSYYTNIIRKHKNNLDGLKNAPNGSAILANYQKILKDSQDFEDSLQTATWYLKNDIITSIDFFFQNVILVQPELLDQQRNKNANDFFFAWCNWMKRHTKCNVFSVNQFGYIFKFKNGSFEYYDHIHHYLFINGETPFDYTGYTVRITTAEQQQPSDNDGCFF